MCDVEGTAARAFGWRARFPRRVIAPGMEGQATSSDRMHEDLCRARHPRRLIQEPPVVENIEEGRSETSTTC
jgi:hypothetical protein